MEFKSRLPIPQFSHCIRLDYRVKLFVFRLCMIIEYANLIILNDEHTELMY